jgi:hypothetical protein
MIEQTWLRTPFLYLTNGGAIVLTGIILLSIFGAFWIGRKGCGHKRGWLKRFWWKWLWWVRFW